MIRVLALILGLFLSTCCLADLPDYVDLSEPKAAAYSMAVALAKGDMPTVRAIYVGDEKAFLSCLNAWGEAKDAGRRFDRVAKSRFGPKAAGLVELGEREIELGGKGRSPLSVLVAVGNERQAGDEAVIDVLEVSQIRLRKIDQQWKITSFGLSTETMRMMLALCKHVAAASTRVTDEMEKGEYQKPHQVVEALLRATTDGLDKVMEEAFPEMTKPAQEMNGPADPKTGP